MRQWHAFWFVIDKQIRSDLAEGVDDSLSAISGFGALAAYRSDKRAWFVLVSLLGIAAAMLLIFDASARQPVIETWRQMADLQPKMLGLVCLLKLGQALCSAAIWRNILTAAYPDRPISYKFVLGVDQGQDAINSVAPAKAGTWALLSAFRLSIPGSKMPTMLGVWAVQSIGFAFFAIVNMIVLALTAPSAANDQSSMPANAVRFIGDHPVLLTALIALAALVAVFAARRLHPAIVRTRKQLRLGGAILGSPKRYLLLVFLPTAACTAFRVAIVITLLSAFAIPVTVATVALAIASQSVAGAVKVTPGGIGTTQAISIVALQSFASVEAVTAYSLTDTALNGITSLLIGVVALFWTFGWTRSKLLIRRRAHAAIFRSGLPQ